jgi:hypothetical protein
MVGSRTVAGPPAELVRNVFFVAFVSFVFFVLSLVVAD